MHLADRRRIGDKRIEAVVAPERKRGKASPDRPLVRRVDVAVVSDVGRDDHPGVRLLGRELRLRELDARYVLAPRRELHEVELEAGVLELRRPPLVERVHLVAVALGLVPVRAALVPDEALHGHRTPWLDHLVPQYGRLLHRVKDRPSRHGVRPCVHLDNRELRRLADGFRRTDIARARRPGVDVRAAAVGAYDPNRDVERVVERDGEINPHGGEARGVAEILGRERPPGDRISRLAPRRRASPVVAREHAAHGLEVRDSGEEDALAVTVVRIAEDERHVGVGLSAAEPDFTDKHVLDLDAVRPERPSLLRGGHRREADKPPPLRVRSRRHALPRERDGHLFAGFGGSPDGGLRVALENHAVRERRDLEGGRV